MNVKQAMYWMVQLSGFWQERASVTRRLPPLGEVGDGYRIMSLFANIMFNETYG
jgi:hypothetical protein